MSNKKNSKNNLPFANEIKQMKAEFKKMIDTMSDEEFIDLVSFLMFSTEEFEDEDWSFDEEWEDEAEKFYNQGNNKSNNITLINDYCKKNNITYTQHQDLDMICKIGASVNMPSFYEGYMEMVNAPIHKSEEYEEVISLLSHKIRMSMLSNVRFGIMEYYSYFNVDLLKLKSYIEQKPSIDTKNELVLSFINELESANALEKVEYTEALKVKEPKKFINGIYINDHVFRGAVSKLLVSRYPVLTGTLDYAYTLYEKGRLENLSKQKIKTRFEEKIERGRKHGGCS